MSKLPRGFSFQINGGRYGGFWVSFTGLSWRIALGWIAITLFFFDFEPVFHDAIQKSKGAKGEKSYE